MLNKLKNLFQGKSENYPYIKFGLRFEEISYYKNSETHYEFSICPPKGTITFSNDGKFLNLEMNEKVQIIDQIISHLTIDERSKEVNVEINCNTEFEVNWLSIINRIENYKKIKQVSMTLIKYEFDKKIKLYKELQKKNIDIILDDKLISDFENL